MQGHGLCFVEMEIEEDDMTMRTYFDIYASDNGARSYSKISVGFFGSYESDVWIDENQIAWQMDDGETVAKSKVAISGLIQVLQKRFCTTLLRLSNFASYTTTL